jgi:hypothetical protein
VSGRPPNRARPVLRPIGYVFRRFGVVSPATDQNTDSMTFTRNIGMLLLAIYLIVVGLVGIFGLALGILLPALALVAGIFILVGR